MNHRACAALIVLLSLAGPVLSSPPEDSCHLFSRTNQWAEAVDCLNFRLYETPASDTAALIRLYEALGVGYMMLERRGPAYAVFKRLLELAPGHEIDPTAYLPEVISLFQTVKLEVRRNTLPPPPPPPPPSLWKKAAGVLPFGIPQAMKGDKKRAWGYFGFQALALSASIFARGERNALHAPEFGYAEEHYNDARRYDLAYKSGFGFFVTGWFASVIDARLRPDTVGMPPCSR